MFTIPSKYSKELSEKVKVLFKTVREYSIDAENKNSIEYDLQIKLDVMMRDLTKTEAALSKTVSHPISIGLGVIIKNILCTIFYDFIDKMDKCEETKTMLVDILKNAEIGHTGLKIAHDEESNETNYYIVKSNSSKIMKTLIEVCQDDEFTINFIKEYITELINIDKYTNILDILKFVNWNNVIMDYVEELILEDY